MQNNKKKENKELVQSIKSGLNDLEKKIEKMSQNDELDEKLDIVEAGIN